MGVLARVRVTDKIEILQDGSIQVRWADYITEDGVIISSPIYTRVALGPGDDISKITDQRILDVVALIWTPDVIKDYKDKIAAQEKVVKGEDVAAAIDAKLPKPEEPK